MKTSRSCNRFDTSMILMYIGLAITIATVVLYALMRSGHATPVAIEDVFAGFMVGQIFFNFGIVLKVSELRK